jgi:hypothetical protein
MSKPLPIFDRRIFWDVDFDDQCYDGKSGFIEAKGSHPTRFMSSIGCGSGRCASH